MRASRRAFIGGVGAWGVGAWGVGAWGMGGCAAGGPLSPAPVNTARVPGFETLSGFCDGVPPADADELAARRIRAGEVMSRAGVDALWLEAGPSLQYFTGVRWRRSERPLLCCVAASGGVGFVAPAFEARTLRERVAAGGGGASFAEAVPIQLWDEHVSPYARAAALAGALKVAGGVAHLEVTARTFVRDGLRVASVASAWAEGVNVASTVRIRKTPAELARLRRATEATKAALAAVADEVAPGMEESDVRALVVAAQQAAGLSQIWALVLFGANASFPHGTQQRRVLQEDDLVLVDTGGFLHGYASDVTRTWPATSASRIDDARRTAFDTVLRAQTAGLGRIVAGAPAAEADAAARAVMADAGFGADYETFTHRLGHGIGLEVHEAPYLVRDARQVLAPGMTMSNEPGLYVPGRWGIRIEDIVAVTDEGPEVFGPRALGLERPFGDA